MNTDNDADQIASCLGPSSLPHSVLEDADRLLPPIATHINSPSPLSQQCGTTDHHDGDFAWTIKATDVLLRLRFRTMRERFQGCKNAAQLKRSWILLASETSRLGGLVVDSSQCKSKVRQCLALSGYNIKFSFIPFNAFIL